MTKNKVLLTAVGAAVVLVVLVIYSFNSRLRLVSTQPTSGGQAIDAPTSVVFSFNQEMGPSSLSGSSDSTSNIALITPATAGRIETKSKSIVFTPSQPLLGNQTYTVSLSHVISLSGKSIPSVALSFITKATASTDKEAALIKTLPYQGDGFVIDYITSSQTITISIYNDPATEKRQAAETYIKSFGLDPAAERISVFLGPDVTGGTSGP